MTAHKTEGMEVVIQTTECAQRLIDESGEPIENIIEETVSAPYFKGMTNIGGHKLKTGEILLICWIKEEKRLLIIEDREYIRELLKEELG